MGLINQGCITLGLALLLFAIARHLTVAITLTYVNFKVEQAQNANGYIAQPRPTHFFAVFALINLLNLVQSARFDKKVISSKVFSIDFRRMKPKYRIFLDKL